MNISNIQIRETGYEDASLWDNYITSHKQGLAYHFFAWKKAIEASYGFECPYFLAKQGDKICGILPTVHIHPPLKKGRLVSLPYCDVGGILADSPEISKILFNYACQYALEHRVPGIEIRLPPHTNKSMGSGYFNKNDISQPFSSNCSTPEKVRMLFKLPDTAKDLMASFKSKLRSQIKKPGRDGLIFKLGGIELFKHFYSVFAENMHVLGSPVHSKNWLSNVLKYYGEKARCGVVFMPDKTPAAAGIILCHDRTVSIPWASSLQRFNRFNPNMLLYWSFLEFAVNNRYQFFDFGRSTPGEGTYKFKAQWGAKPQALHWERWEIGKTGFHPLSIRTPPNLTGRNRDMAEKIIQKLPLQFATFLGSRLRKYISL